MTNLPASPFMNSGAHVPVASGSAADSLLPPSQSAAALSVSDDEICSCDSSGTEAAARSTSAASDLLQAAGALDATNFIPEIFRVANLLCEDARIFVPDYPSLYQAMLDPSSPRALETDPVWADEAPLFLKSIG